MKKQYIEPSIKVRRIEGETMLQASNTFSLPVNGGEPDRDSNGNIYFGAKSNFFDDAPDNGGINWDDEE